MKIDFNSPTTYCKANYRQPGFRGKGIDLMNNWLQETSTTNVKWYKDAVHDFAEGAKLYFEANKTTDNSVINLHKINKYCLTMFFELSANEILKVSLLNPLEFRKHIPEFDIPFLSPVEKYGKTYIVKQPKADTKGITIKHIKDVGYRISGNGYELSLDGNCSEQYGLYNGKAYLIDTRCAMPMPNKFTVIIDNICKNINECYIFVNREEEEQIDEEGYKKQGYFCYHIDETPRKNLTLKEAIVQLFQTVKINLKYSKNNYRIPYKDSLLLTTTLQNKIPTFYESTLDD